jgi:hypothetical protein
MQQLAIKFPFAPRIIIRVLFSLGLGVLAGLSVLPVRRYWELVQPFSKQFIGVYTARAVLGVGAKTPD